MTDDPTSAVARPPTIGTEDGERLEVAWSGPADPDLVVVLTHPHPQYGGDMHNLVPATLARVLPEQGHATVRVNFRGTGSSTGTHGGGEAEISDVRAAVDAAAETHPTATVAAVGYSFGADVLLAVDDPRLAAVVAVAPPLAVLDIARLRNPRGACPTLVLAAEHDQFRPFADARTAVAEWPATDVEPIDGTDHFLAGASNRVADAVVTFLADINPRR